MVERRLAAEEKLNEEDNGEECYRKVRDDLSEATDDTVDRACKQFKETRQTVPPDW